MPNLLFIVGPGVIWMPFSWPVTYIIGWLNFNTAHSYVCSSDYSVAKKRIIQSIFTYLRRFPPLFCLRRMESGRTASSLAAVPGNRRSLRTARAPTSLQSFQALPLDSWPGLRSCPKQQRLNRQQRPRKKHQLTCRACEI